jgi:hypothetical protein
MLVYGEKASRTHENQMLSVFLNQLESRWATSTDWILAIANTMWDGAEIDLVCILPSAIIVADFKKHEGKLTGPKTGHGKQMACWSRADEKLTLTSNSATTSFLFLTGWNQRRC